MKKKTSNEKIILGLDPGTSIMGYGVVMLKGPMLNALQMGVIHLSKLDSHELRLHKIFDRVLAIIDDFHPDEVALEAPFYGKNIQSMIKLGRAQGVAMAASLHRKIPIFEYAPRKVKQSVTGNGNASKEQVASMLIKLFRIEKMPEYMDATDALAVAVCHHHQNGMGKAKKNTWKGFIKDNPTRVRK